MGKETEFFLEKDEDDDNDIEDNKDFDTDTDDEEDHHRSPSSSSFYSKQWPQSYKLAPSTIFLPLYLSLCTV